MMFTVVTLAAVASWLLASGWRLAADSPFPFRLIAGMAANAAWTAVPVFLLSLVVTWMAGGNLRPGATVKALKSLANGGFVKC
jgi:hypothetical protein